MTTSDAIQTLCYLDVNEHGPRQDALELGIDAIKRLEAIRRRHQKGAVTTDAGTVVYASIHGRELHELLYGEVE